jgi:AcrR family transcriptional regulator
MGILERKEREKEARRNQILDAAESVFAAKGIASATMDDIAREAELAKGTIYLYYKNKDELQVGLILRSFEMMNEAFIAGADTASLAIEKLKAVGSAYWKFSEMHPLHFSMMCNSDLPQRRMISDELFTELSERSSDVWRFLVSLVEEAKKEGTIKKEIDSFSLSMFLWMMCMSIMRLYQRTKLDPESVLSAKKEFSIANANFPLLFDYSMSAVLSHAITEEGAKYIVPFRFPSMKELGVDPGNVLDSLAKTGISIPEQLLKESKIPTL